jgi:hypothetical protein
MGPGKPVAFLFFERAMISRKKREMYNLTITICPTIVGNDPESPPTGPSASRSRGQEHARIGSSPPD